MQGRIRDGSTSGKSAQPHHPAKPACICIQAVRASIFQHRGPRSWAYAPVIMRSHQIHSLHTRSRPSHLPSARHYCLRAQAREAEAQHGACPPLLPMHCARARQHVVYRINTGAAAAIDRRSLASLNSTSKVFSLTSFSSGSSRSRRKPHSARRQISGRCA